MGRDFDTLVDEALATPFEGWDFSPVHGRYEVEPLPWSYKSDVEAVAASARTFVDLGTGGGEFVASLSVRPPVCIATEAWMPNVGVAAARLRPLGAYVLAVEGAPDNADQTPDSGRGRLPFRDGSLDVVINRHESFLPREVARVLRPGGTLLTQQVGGNDEVELNKALSGPPPYNSPDLAEYVRQLQGVGLEIVRALEAFPLQRYFDVGAIAYKLKAIPWMVDGFDVTRDRETLRPIHERIERDGSFETHPHRLLLEATKP